MPFGAEPLIVDLLEKFKYLDRRKPEVFILAPHSEGEIIDQLSSNLKNIGLIVNTYQNLKLGGDWAKGISEMISASDIYIVLVSENFPESNWMTLEATMIATQSRHNSSKLLIPIVFSSSEIPIILAQWQNIIIDRNNLPAGINKIISTVYEYIVGLEKQAEKESAVREEVKKSSAKYVEKSPGRLKSRESQERILAHFWQAIGFILLITGAYLSYIILNQSEQAVISEQGIAAVIYISFKSLFVIALVIAGVKYAFDLSKAHMNESLKNSDRIHAISFGEFYLDAYSESVNWEEIKEVFQHWNINSESYFTKLDSKNYEPDLLEKAIDLVRAASDKK